MDKHNNKTQDLQQYVKYLNILSGQFNLYICLCHKKRTPDIEKLKLEITKIKNLVMDIEYKIDRL